MTVTIESPIKEPQLVPNVPPAPRTWRDDIFDRVLAEDSEYQQAQTDIASYKARISELENERIQFEDSFADVDEHNQDELDRRHDCILSIDREITVLNSRIRKVNRSLPEIERAAFDRRIASELEKVAELQEAADQLKITDETSEKVMGIDFGNEGMELLYKMRQRYLEAMSVLGERQQFLQRIEKIYSVRYSNG